MQAEGVQRPALARRSGLPRQTVSDLMSGLETQGLVHVDGRFSGHPGRSGLSYRLDADAAVALAFDIGRTEVVAAMTDLRGATLAETVHPTAGGTAAELVDQLDGMATDLCQLSGIERFRVRHAAAGVPGTTDGSGKVTSARSLPALADAAMQNMLEQRLKCSVRFDNDANMALLGEILQGIGRGYANVAFLALGAGVGAGLLIDGRLLRGHRGGAGEIALLRDMTVPPGAPGNLEAFTGASGIAAEYERRGGRSGVSAEFILDAAAEGEIAAEATIADLARRIAYGIATLASVADPELLIMGGPLGARPDLISRVTAELPNFMHRPLSVRASSFGPRAGLTGALCVARLDMLELIFGPHPEGAAW